MSTAPPPPPPAGTVPPRGPPPPPPRGGGNGMLKLLGVAAVVAGMSSLIPRIHLCVIWESCSFVCNGRCYSVIYHLHHSMPPSPILHPSISPSQSLSSSTPF